MNLTERHGSTVVYTGSDQFPQLPANMLKVPDVEKILERLNEYEATGLTPEQIEQITEDAERGSTCQTCKFLGCRCYPLNEDEGCKSWQWRGVQE